MPEVAIERVLEDEDECDQTPTPEPSEEQLYWRKLFLAWDESQKSQEKADEFEEWFQRHQARMCRECWNAPAAGNSKHCRLCQGKLNRKRERDRKRSAARQARVSPTVGGT